MRALYTKALHASWCGLAAAVLSWAAAAQEPSPKAGDIPPSDTRQAEAASPALLVSSEAPVAVFTHKNTLWVVSSGKGKPVIQSPFGAPKKVSAKGGNVWKITPPQGQTLPSVSLKSPQASGRLSVLALQNDIRFSAEKMSAPVTFTEGKDRIVVWPTVQAGGAGALSQTVTALSTQSGRAFVVPATESLVQAQGGVFILKKDTPSTATQKTTAAKPVAKAAPKAVAAAPSAPKESEPKAAPSEKQAPKLLQKKPAEPVTTAAPKPALKTVTKPQVPVRLQQLPAAVNRAEIPAQVLNLPPVHVEKSVAPAQTPSTKHPAEQPTKQVSFLPPVRVLDAKGLRATILPKKEKKMAEAAPLAVLPAAQSRETHAPVQPVPLAAREAVTAQGVVEGAMRPTSAPKALPVLMPVSRTAASASAVAPAPVATHPKAAEKSVAAQKNSSKTEPAASPRPVVEAKLASTATASVTDHAAPRQKESEKAAVQMAADKPAALPVEGTSAPIPTLNSNLKKYASFHQKALKAFVGTHAGPEREAALFKLAQTELAFQRPLDAEGLLQNLPLKEGETTPVDDAARLLTAIARTAANRPQEALPLLNDPLQGKAAAWEGDRELWRAAALEATGNTKEAVELFTKRIDKGARYPAWVQEKLLLSYVRALAAQNQWAQVKERMEGVLQTREEKNVPPEVLLWLGRAADALGNSELARNVLSQAANAEKKDPFTGNAAKLAYLELLFKGGDLENDQMIENLNRLRQNWHGEDATEHDALLHLGQLQLQEGQLREGLETLKYFSTYFPTSPKREIAAAQMNEAFTAAFTGQRKIDMEPLTALGIYYDFKELTPAGQTGEEIVWNVARRLKGLGLFDRAAELLSHQINLGKQTPAVKARWGRELADVYALNNQFNEGLSALEQTEGGKAVTAAEQAERKLVQAKLLIALRRFDEARNVLGKLKGAEAEKLAAQIEWQEQNYPALLAVLAQGKEKAKGVSATVPAAASDALTTGQLAVTYHQLNKPNELHALTVAVSSQTETGSDLKVLPAAMAFLGMDRKPDAETLPAEASITGAWKGLTDIIRLYNIAYGSYTSITGSTEKERVNHAIYNRRMGQPNANLLGTPPISERSIPAENAPFLAPPSADGR